MKVVKNTITVIILTRSKLNSFQELF